jgi:hypothetical protein
MHRAFSYFLVLSLINSTLSLKLLTASDDNGDGHVRKPNIPEEWESDIQFSFTPFKGKCKSASDSDEAAPMPAANGYTANALCNEKCAHEDNTASAADKENYCAGTKTFNALLAEDVALMVADPPELSIKFCAHLVAKYITMGQTDAKCKTKPATSFSMKADTCDILTYKGSGATAGNENAGDIAAHWFCYGPPGVTWAKNDPKVKNMDGEEFDIMTTGTFTLLSLQKTSSTKTSLEVLSTIDRAGTRCGATYIQNITLRGQWVEDVGFQEIKVRAVPAVPKKTGTGSKF